MRKGILFMLLCLTSIVAVACGGGNNASGNGGGGDSAECGGGDGGECGGGDGGECGGGDGGEVAEDPYAIYKTVGNMWKHKSTTKMEGMDPMVSYTSFEVIEVMDDKAKVKMTSFDKDGNETFSNESEIPFATGEATDGGDAPEVERTKETVTVEAGEFECWKMTTEAGGNKTTSWTSVEHPGLSVKSETTGSANVTSELVEYEVK